MGKVQSGAELYEHIDKMSRKNSVTQIYIPGKGTFTIVLQEEETPRYYRRSNPILNFVK